MPYRPQIKDHLDTSNFDSFPSEVLIRGSRPVELQQKQSTSKSLVSKTPCKNHALYGASPFRVPFTPVDWPPDSSCWLPPHLRCALPIAYEYLLAHLAPIHCQDYSQWDRYNQPGLEPTWAKEFGEVTGLTG